MGLINSIVGGVMDLYKASKQNIAQKNDTVNNIAVKNLYSINVPSFLSPTDKFGEDISLQYWNRTLDVALYVIDESKSEFIEAMKDVEETGFFDNIEDETLLDKLAAVSLNNMFDIDKIEMSDYTKLQINGLNAVKVNVFQKRTFLKDAVYCCLTFVEGKETLYQIIIMLGGTSIRKLSDKLEEAVYSFREL